MFSLFVEVDGGPQRAACIVIGTHTAITKTFVPREHLRFLDAPLSTRFLKD
jgi:hypothetical protein